MLELKAYSYLGRLPEEVLASYLHLDLLLLRSRFLPVALHVRPPVRIAGAGIIEVSLEIGRP